MSKIYNGQSSLRIKLTTGVDITGATTKQIKYKKPGGTTGAWDTTVESATTGVIYYDIQDGDIDESGYWTFWAYIVFSDGRDAVGESVSERIYIEGD